MYVNDIILNMSAKNLEFIRNIELVTDSLPSSDILVFPGARSKIAK